MREEPASMRVKEARSDTTSPSNGEVNLQLGQRHQMSLSNGEKNTTEINLDASIMASPCGEENNVPSQYYRIIPEYKNLRI